MERSERFDIVIFKYPDDELFSCLSNVLSDFRETKTVDGKAYINDSENATEDSYVPTPLGKFRALMKYRENC